MAYRDLQEFLKRLEELGELHRVGVEVDPVLEIAEITGRVSRAPDGGKALFFERVKGSRFPVVTNIFGSPRRLAAALEIDRLDELSRHMERLLASVETSDGLGASPLLEAFAPRIVGSGVCQEVEEPVVDLTSYPVLKSWPGDGWPAGSGRFITLPLVITRDPESGRVNCGMYRVEVFGRSTAAIHWQRESGGAGHYESAIRRNERLPVAVVLGGEPALTYAATVPFPNSVDEREFAGFLRGSPLEFVRCRSNELAVPAGAEIVIEGYLDPGDVVPGGAFGNHTGSYVPGAPVPLMHVTAVTRRESCVYPATVVGPPPREDCFFAKATERLFLPLMMHELPEIVDINLPLEGIFHGCAIIAITGAAPGDARRVLERLWSRGWLRQSRLLVLIDAEVDVRDLSQVAWRVLNNVVWSRDVIISSPPADWEVPASGRERAGIDATRKGAGEDSPEEVVMTREVKRLVEERWRAYGFTDEA